MLKKHMDKPKILIYVKKPFINIGFPGWMAIEFIFIVLGAAIIFELLNSLYFTIYPDKEPYNHYFGLCMTISISVLIALIISAFSQFLYVYIKELNHGIHKIASGDYIKLDEEKSGPLRDIYHNINIMSEELSGIDSMRNEFITEFSHECKTPLASINGFANLLMEENCSKEQAMQYLTIIANESEHLITLTQNQLILTKLDSQHIVINKENYFLDEEIRQCVIILSSQWEGKKQEVSLELSSIPIYASRELLHHVWMNLISNAIKYTPENGEISITSRISGSMVSISITDTGIGMTDEETKYIFTKYYRAKNSVDIKGLGLGLPIVKRAVELSGGKIEVQSSPDEGSTFTVTLPLE